MNSVKCVMRASISQKMFIASPPAVKYCSKPSGTSVNKNDKKQIPCGAYILRRETDNKNSNSDKISELYICVWVELCPPKDTLKS